MTTTCADDRHGAATAAATMQRRALLAAIGVAAAIAPLVTLAQPQRIRKVGFLGANTPAAAGHLAAAFVARLKELGWIEGRNLVIEWRWAAGQSSKLRELSAELVAAHVDVIVTSGTVPALAAHAATQAIPIVLASSGNLVTAGLAQSLARPGGNVTGLTFANDDLAGKRLQLLREALPGLQRVAVLRNPEGSPSELAALRAASVELAMALDMFDFRGVADLDLVAKFDERSPIGAMLVLSDPLVFTNRAAINEFALRRQVPTMHSLKEYAVDGGLMSYGSDFIAQWRRAAEFVDKILKGARAEDLPIEQPTKFELAINLATAKALGITIPQSLLLRADEVLR